MNFSDPKLIPVAIISFLSLIAVISTFCLLKRKQQGIGFNTMRLLGLCVFLPFLLSIAFYTEINKEALTAIIGTIAGYILSNSEDKQ